VGSGVDVAERGGNVGIFARRHVRELSCERVRPGDGCYLGENLAAHAMTNFAERGSLGIRQLQPTFQLGLQDAVFGSQIFVSRQQLWSTVPVT
jgi:hypothetical protein